MSALTDRHPKEKLYYSVCLVFSLAAYVAVIIVLYYLASPVSVSVLLVTILTGALSLWITEQFFKALVFGNAVKITELQFPEIHAIIQKQIQALGLEKEIDVFIYNGQGLINAIALKFISKKYVILMANLVDLMLKRGAYPELEMIIGHELAHHSLKHTSLFRVIALWPSNVIPLLGLAYSRGCEYSADQVAFELTKSNKSAIRGLLSITLGSEALSNEMDIKSFVYQERSVPGFFGFLANAFSTHPRMTRRIEELLPKWDMIQVTTVTKKEVVYGDSRYSPSMT